MAVGRPRSCECGSCAKCRRRAAQARWYAKKTPEERSAIVTARDPEKRRANDRARSRTPARRRHIDSNKKRWRTENPEKDRAHSVVSRAVRSGRLKKQPCEKCSAVRVHAHHDDYSKPLEVRWLCPLHHAMETAASRPR